MNSTPADPESACQKESGATRGPVLLGIFFGAALLAAVALSLKDPVPANQFPSASIEEESLASPEQPGPTSAKLKFDLQPGSRLRYEYEWKTNSNGQLSLSKEKDEQKIHVEVSASGDLYIDVVKELKSVDGGSNLLFRVTFPQSRVNLAVDGKRHTNGILEGISKGSFLVLGSDAGEFQGWRHENFNDIKIDTKTENLAKSILLAFQTSLPREGLSFPEHLPLWTVEQNVDTGKATAHYKLTSFDKNEIQIEKSFPRQQVILPAGKVLSSTLEGISQVWLKKGVPFVWKIEGSEKWIQNWIGREISVTQAGFRFRFVGQETLLNSSAVISSVSRESFGALQLSEGEKDLQKQIQEQELGVQTSEQLLAQLDALQSVGGKVDQSALTQLYLKFKALFALKPDSAKEALNILKSEEAGSVKMQVLVGALSASGSREAQRVLVELAEARQAERKFFSQVIPMLGMAENPGTEVENFLRKTAHDESRPEMARGAQLSLGILASKAQKDSPEITRRIVQENLENLKKATTTEKKKLYLSALGNTGDVSVVPALLEMMQDSNPTLRSKAVDAARRIPFSASKDIYVRAFRDSISAVRESAATSLQMQVPTEELIKFQMDIFGQENSEEVAIVLLRNVWRGRQIFPLVISFVTEIAQKNRSEKIRLVAQSLFDEERVR